MFQANCLPMVNESLLVYFVTHCKSVLKLKYETIKLYLAGIRFYYIRAGHGDMLKGCDQLNYVLGGIKRSQNNVTKKRLPITADILKQLWKVLDKGAFSPFVDLMLKCMFSCAYFGFLRCGEITCQNANSAQFLHVSDVSLGGDFYMLKLRTSKTDPFSRGVNITIYENTVFKPVHIMRSYLQVRNVLPCSSQSPLFINDEFSLVPMLRDTFIQHLRSLLMQIGLKDLDYAGHSFRIGAATAAAAAGVEDHIIKDLGRWTSDCYVRYIRTDSEVLRRAQQKLCNF